MRDASSWFSMKGFRLIVAALHRSPVAFVIGSLNLRDDAGGLFASVVSEVAAAKESETKISAVKSFVFIVRERVDRQAAAKIPKHLWPLARLSRRAQSKGFQRSGHVHNVRKGDDCGFHDVEFAKHRRCENVQARIVLE